MDAKRKLINLLVENLGNKLPQLLNSDKKGIDQVGGYDFDRDSLVAASEGSLAEVLDSLVNFLQQLSKVRDH
ncbi:hypothetical protein L228DRAFT_64215 [Xylona heveae TC161]|uniref:Uncharacterized protein n=1 Tax=Xylona heveae (strain CBS 132557 / TC161) TaxID=1328760 RepID=A0A165IPZ6_XYLHT|nr:hypothetical protein L228DRAFT_64215 [Xylona heveae TC161]KZF25214.1 hypothetical protein L228DRAFT_64215 [Xylona heveae TC161]